MRRRSLAAAAAVAAALVTLPAAASGAGRADQIRDAAGDARADQRYADIVTARWSSTGRGDEKALVVSMTLAAPPRTDKPFVYELKSGVRDCGTVWFQWAPGSVANDARGLGQNDPAAGASVWIECESASTTGGEANGLVYKVLTFTVTGNTITWSIPLWALPPQLQVGAVFSNFTAAADVGEPVFGQSMVGGEPFEGLDYAVGDGLWRLR